MSNEQQEKNILVDRGIKPSGRDINPYGSGGGLGSGQGGGFNVGFGSGGGGFSGGFGGSARSRSKKRAKARAAAIAAQQANASAAAIAAQQAQAQAEREQAHAKYVQQLDAFTQMHTSKRQEWDQAYAAKSSNLTSQLKSELAALRKAPSDYQRDHDWGLYLISKKTSEIAKLISAKNSELQTRNAQLLTFDGRPPFSRTPADYRQTLLEQTAHNPDGLNQIHKNWEQAYIAEHEANLLAESIRQLSEQTQALAISYAEREVVAREQAVLAERRQQYGKQRLEQIKHQLRVEENQRRELIKAANTFTVPASAATATVLTRSGVAALEGLAGALENAVLETVAELARVLAIRAGQTIALTATSLLYSAELGNGELTPKQHRRLFQGVGVVTDTLKLPAPEQLQAIADLGGFIEADRRIRPVAVDSGIEFHVVTTGTEAPAKVRVVNAVFDAATDSYVAQTNTSPSRLLMFKAPTIASAVPTSVTPEVPSRLSATAPLAVELPLGVDIRIDDCVICFPEASNLKPRYFSFMVDPVGQGIVNGNGHEVSQDWWQGTHQEQGAVIPVQMGEQLRSREFRSFETFDKNIWRMVANNATLSKSFDEINLKRITRGFPPYAPKSTWVGDRREFELRTRAPADLGVDDFNLDKLRITAPNSSYGVVRKIPAFTPWPVASGSQTWTPLIPPGIASIGSTELPLSPETPLVYPGTPTKPVETANEALPIPDQSQTGTYIPGFGDLDELPSPDLVFVGPPVEPLEVGPYNELKGRSKLDGLDIDHIVSQQALRRHILQNLPDTGTRELYEYLLKAPSIAIPSIIHQKFSETYGGRNSEIKQIKDSEKLRIAVDSNINAIKPGLLEAGFPEEQIERARANLHQLNNQQGWY